MYHWQDVGWCVGVIRKCNGNKKNTVDGDVVRRRGLRVGVVQRPVAHAAASCHAPSTPKLEHYI